VINIPTGDTIPKTGGFLQPTLEPGTRLYTVVSGDFLSSIDNRYGVSLAALEQATDYQP
jgi:LysM repeat protein